MLINIGPVYTKLGNFAKLGTLFLNLLVSRFLSHNTLTPWFEIRQ